MEPDPTEPVRSETIVDAQQRLVLAQWHLEEIERTFATEQPDVADLAADLAEETEALTEVLDAIDGSEDRWVGVQGAVQR